MKLGRNDFLFLSVVQTGWNCCWKSFCCYSEQCGEKVKENPTSFYFWTTLSSPTLLSESNSLPKTRLVFLMVLLSLLVSLNQQQYTGWHWRHKPLEHLQHHPADLKGVQPSEKIADIQRPCFWTGSVCNLSTPLYHFTPPPPPHWLLECW